MFIVFFYAITVFSKNCEAEMQRQLCEYVVCPDYNEYYPNYEDYPECHTVDPGFETFEGNF